MSEIPVDEMLRRIFKVFVRAAEQNPAFAREIVKALAADVAARSSSMHRMAAHRRFDPSGSHAINVMRSHGEQVLRGKLEQIRASADLRSVARFSRLILSGSASGARASRSDLINAIIAAAKHYDAQRDTASSQVGATGAAWRE
jgi:hypothetical protein